MKCIREIKNEIIVCNFCKQELIEEYFNHWIPPWPHKINTKIEYDFNYKLGVSGKCKLCSRDAYCIIYHPRKQNA